MKKLYGLGFALVLCILAFWTQPAEANEVVGPFSNRKACERAAAGAGTYTTDCRPCPGGSGYCYTAYPPECTAPRQYSGVCVYVVTFAQDPVTGVCCQYPDPCSVPDGWTAYDGPGCFNY